jgi:hypothetical protein
MLTDTELKRARSTDGKACKFTDRDGMYVNVSPSGAKTFRHDYRINGRRETLTVGRYDETLPRKQPAPWVNLSYGIGLSLAEARLLLTTARRSVESGESPARQKADRRVRATEALTFGGWADRYFADKADPNNSGRLAGSTLAMRRSVYDRNLKEVFGKLNLDEITAAALMAQCLKIKARGAPAPVVQAR